MAVTIRPLADADRQRWQEMFTAYATFYKTAVPEGGTDEPGQVLTSLKETVGYLREMAAAADSVADGNLAVEIQPRSERDTLRPFSDAESVISLIFATREKTSADSAGSSSEVKGILNPLL